MIVSCELAPGEEAKLNRAIEAFIRETGRDTWKVLKDQARLLVRDCIRATPPFGRNAFSESFSVQRKIGLAAVSRDIRKVFIPMADFIATRTSPALQDALTENSGIVGKNKRTGKAAIRSSRVNMEALNKIFDNIGMSGAVIQTVIPELHTTQRNRRGRIKDRCRKYVVVDARSIDKYVKEVQSHVGRSKSGWMEAAIGTAVKGIPRWIAGAPNKLAGLFRARESGPTQSITVGNIGLAPEFFERRQFVAVLENRERGMKRQMEEMAKKAAEKANRANSV